MLTKPPLLSKLCKVLTSPTDPFVLTTVRRDRIVVRVVVQVVAVEAVADSVIEVVVDEVVIVAVEVEVVGVDSEIVVDVVVVEVSAPTEVASATSLAESKPSTKSYTTKRQLIHGPLLYSST